VEFDGDGKPDILSGCYSEHDPMAGLFWVLAGVGDGTVKKAEAVKGTDGKPLIIPSGQADIVKSICTQPAAHDWDGDGDMDILTGNFEGTYFLFTNEGTKEKAAFHPKASQTMMPDGKPLHLKGHHSGICPVDWDGDGDADILTGSARGGVYWAENKTSGKTVQVGDFQEILAPPAVRDENTAAPPAETNLPATPGDNTRAWAADVNGDGKVDILLGDSATVTSRVAGLTEEQFTEKQTAWQKEQEAVQKNYATATDDTARQEAGKNMNAHYQKRSQFIKESRTGFVWVMLRK
jgi:hypothetical protein